MLKKRDIHTKLISKFEFTRSEGSHEKFSLYVDGCKILTTHTSRSHNDIDDSLLKLMAREMGVLRLQIIKDMFDCTVSRQDYLRILRENGYFERFQ
jgi:hypothetical protein